MYDLGMRYVLGIETSCDDTSVAVVDEDCVVHANIVSSQVKEHEPFMGVVPELASRAHLRNIPEVYQAALQQARLTLEDMAAVAVTMGPGLLGSLLVGVNFAKGLTYASGLPLVGVNHIRGHVTALFLEHGDLPLPALALIVSGGHTHLFLVGPDRDILLLTKTRDDAAGEAFDKLSKMLGLGFPGGPLIDALAREGDAKAFKFSMPRFNDGSYDYSFSGLKTAAARTIEKDPKAFEDREGNGIRDLCASFQRAVVRQLLDRVRRGARKENPKSLLLGGGVACNSLLRKEFTNLGEDLGLPTFLSSPSLSTDNAAMIAAEGFALLERGETAELSLSADIRQKPYDGVRLL
jgi:N6-L-threonylcarbamoyladenine synthase